MFSSCFSNYRVNTITITSMLLNILNYFVLRSNRIDILQVRNLSRPYLDVLFAGSGYRILKTGFNRVNDFTGLHKIVLLCTCKYNYFM